MYLGSAEGERPGRDISRAERPNQQIEAVCLISWCNTFDKGRYGERLICWFREPQKLKAVKMWKTRVVFVVKYLTEALFVLLW